MVLTEVKKRGYQIKSSAQGLGDRVVEDERGTYRDCGGRYSGYMTLARFASFGVKTTGSTFAGDLWGGSLGGMWHHQRTYFKAKVLREGSPAVRCKEISLDRRYG